MLKQKRYICCNTNAVTETDRQIDTHTLAHADTRTQAFTWKKQRQRNKTNKLAHTGTQKPALLETTIVVWESFSEEIVCQGVCVYVCIRTSG